MTTTWKVSQLDCHPEHEGNEKVVFTVHWSATAQDGEFSGYTYGSASLTLDPEATFVPFADLTEEVVIGLDRQFHPVLHLHERLIIDLLARLARL